MFHLYLTVVFLYVLWRFVIPLPISKGWRAALAVALLAVSKYHFFLLSYYGTMFSPEFPRPLILLAGWLFCGLILLFVFTLLTDVVCGGIALLRKMAVRSVFGVRGRLAIAATALTLSAFGVYQAVQVPGVRHVEVTIDNLAPSLDGLRVVQLTDLHISRLFQADWVEQVVARTNELAPDLILITGDIIDGTVDARREDVAPLGELKAPMGVIAGPGNHEYYFGVAQWGAEFERLGMHLLTNQHRVLNKGADKLVIAGVADEAGPAVGLAGPDLSEALQGVPNDAAVILLKHRPSGAAASAAAGVGLQLSGHTHGGMIRGLDQVVRYANQGFVSGSYDVAGMTLYVSNGTGLWNGFPIRLGVPPEITEIVLRAGPPH